MRHITIIAAIGLFGLALTAVADRKESKESKERNHNEKSKEALLAAIDHLEQRLAKLEKHVKALEAKLEAKTNPFGKMKEIDQKIAKKLQEPLPINFEANKLVNVLDYFRNTTGCSFFVNWAALEAAGVEQSTPITMQLNNVAAAHAMKLVLIQSSPKGGDNAAVFQVHNGVVYITTKKDMNRLTEE